MVYQCFILTKSVYTCMFPQSSMIGWVSLCERSLNKTSIWWTYLLKTKLFINYGKNKQFLYFHLLFSWPAVPSSSSHVWLPQSFRIVSEQPSSAAEKLQQVISCPCRRLLFLYLTPATLNPPSAQLGLPKTPHSSANVRFFPPTPHAARPLASNFEKCELSLILR